MRLGFVFALLLTSLGARAAAPQDGDATRQEPARAAPETIVIDLPAGAFAQLERGKVTTTSHGETHEYEGVDLLAALRASGVEPVESLRGPALSRLLVAEAGDGYRAVFALAELDPTLGKRRIWLVDRMDGKPLPPEAGPWRLIVPDDGRPTRWVWALQRLRVIDTPRP